RESPLRAREPRGGHEDDPPSPRPVRTAQSRDGEKIREDVRAGGGPSCLRSVRTAEFREGERGESSRTRESRGGVGQGEGVGRQGEGGGGEGGGEGVAGEAAGGAADGGAPQWAVQAAHAGVVGVAALEADAGPEAVVADRVDGDAVALD